jgi:dihydrofolate reductase
MQRLTSIVAVNRAGVIGCGNTLPWRLKTDMRFFRETTTGNVVLMGRKTFDSLQRRCLPNRQNIVISHTFGLFVETDECRPAYGIEEALFRATRARKKSEEVFVIGGASMYAQFARYVDRYLVTMVEKDVPDGDTFFDQEPLGDPDRWTITELFSCSGSADDEASFTVFEVLSKQPGEFQARRNEAIQAAELAATTGKQSKAKSSSRRPAATFAEASYSMF